MLTEKDIIECHKYHNENDTAYPKHKEEEETFPNEIHQTTSNQ